MTGKPVRVVVAAVVSALLVVGAVVVVPSSSPVGAVDGPTVSLGDASGLERDVVTGSVFVPVFLSEPAVAPVVVSFFSVDGTATAGQDYSRWGTPASPRSVTIPAGALQTTINVPVLADAAVESDEAFSVQLASVSGGSAVIGDDTGVATIVDADGVSGVNPAITVSSGTVVEGDAGQRRAQFFVHLSRAPETNVTISYTSADGTAVAPGDYTAKLPGTVVFAPGQISKTVDVSIGSNTVDEADRTLSLEVSVTGGSPVEELAMSGSATIVDDDTGGPELVAATALVSGNGHSCALLVGGTVRCWGSNAYGQLGDGTTTSSSVPVEVVGLTGVTAIAAGDGHTCAVVAAGAVRCWGRNQVGQLGNGTTVDSSLPVQVSGLTDVTAIAAGLSAACAVVPGGAVKCWGFNLYGGLGDGTTTPSSTPVDVVGVTGAVSASMGAGQSCALLAAGQVKCWGYNGYGGLGNGASGIGANTSTAVDVVGLSDAVGLAVGFHHGCARRAGGTVVCWGRNNNGQLGNGALFADSSVPVPVSSLTGATALGSGYFHTCAVVAGGAIDCWGDNEMSQLGHGLPGDSAVPVSVSGLVGALAVSAGSGSTCALMSAGGVKCWGGNTTGQLGNGTLDDSASPVDVVGLG